jgi:hypothetical protein
MEKTIMTKSKNLNTLQEKITNPNMQYDMDLEEQNNNCSSKSEENKSEEFENIQ